MAKSVFNATLEPNNRIDVNAFDLSHTYHATFDQGIIYPVFWHRLPPKSSIRINMEAGIQQFQTVFPLQTSQRLRLNAFKVELRALDEDYTERVSNNSDTEEPSVVNPLMRTNTGSLFDYLGLPTTVIQSTFGSPTTYNATNGSLHYEVGGPLIPDSHAVSNYAYFDTASLTGSEQNLSVTSSSDPVNGHLFYDVILTRKDTSSKYYVVDIITVNFNDSSFNYNFKNCDRVYVYSPVNKMIPTNSITVRVVDKLVEHNVGVDVSKTFVNAYPFRAYEAIYNSFYRDTRNNPRIVDGKPIYNKWLPNNKSGKDNVYYELHRCNWAPDAFTTAVPDPQQGMKAPLAGLTTYTKTTTLESGEIEARVATAIIDEDGKAYGLDFKSNEDGTALSEVTYTELGAEPNMQRINSLEDLVTQGLSIETLRAVNAYQKFLELNMRKGYLYKDIIQGRWDVNIRYDELLMPEFIGGMSRELNTNSVTQTVDNSANGDYATALGSQAGISGVYGNMDGNIECFCDEESIVMVCLTITPTPIYSQLFPRQFMYRQLLDSFQPEFDNIGFQPILSRELSTSYLVASSDIIFGYQRPWYEYLWKPDTAHGDFRLSLRNFLMQRVFPDVPKLGSNFLLVDRDQMNDVYAVSKVDNVPINDHYYGYIKFNITARMPITRVAIPRLD